MDLFYPTRPHFPASREAAARFSVFIKNPGTLSQYWGHVRFGENLFLLDHLVPASISGQLSRGARAGHLPAARPRFLKDDVLKLIRLAVKAGDVDSARLYAVARAWLARAANELFPLQRNGRAGLSSADAGWHSRVTFTTTRAPSALPGQPREHDSPPEASRRLVATIRLRTRKNAPFGERISRACTCVDLDFATYLLCGPCNLRAAVVASIKRGDSESARIFPSEATLRSRFRHYCTEAQLRAGWHAFRRGAASDMLRSGSSVGDILLAGSWRSGAFLRYLRRAELDTRASLHTVGAGDPGLLEAVFDHSGSDA